MRTRDYNDKTFQKILATSRHEFFTNGVKNTSIRTIAKKADVALGSIYRYVESKEELLKLTLAPLLEAIDNYTNRYRTQNKQDLAIFSPHNNLQQTIDEISLIVKKYRSELKLLLFDSANTSLQNYMQRFTDKMTEVSMLYLRDMKQKYPHLKTDFSPLLMRIICSGWNAVLYELTLHEELSSTEIENIVAGYISFSKGGWKNLMDVKIE